MDNSELFACAITSCRKTFRTRSRYSQHLKTHSKPFKCISCTKGFALRHDLNRHVQAKHRVGGKRFPCTKCDFKATRRDNLSHHLKICQRRGMAESRNEYAKMSISEVQIKVNKATYEPTNLLRAAEVGNIKILERLLNTNLSISTRGDDGSTALHSAARAGQTAAVEYLLERGAPIDSTNEKGRTSLHEAVAGRNQMVVELLTRRGSATGAEDEKGFTPIHITAQQGDVEMTDFIIEHGGLSSKIGKIRHLFRTAVKAGHASIIRLLCTSVDTNTIKFQDWYLLHLAVKCGHEDIVRTFLEDYGSQFNVNQRMFKNMIFWTPLMLAAEHGHEGIVRLMLSNNAEVSRMRYYERKPALHCAIENGHINIARTLMNHKTFNMEILEDNDASKYLAQAARNGHTSLVELLLGCLDVERHSSFQMMVPESAWSGHIDVLKLLFSHDKFRLQGKYAEKAILVAARNGHRDFLELLHSHNSNGRIVLDEQDQPLAQRVIAFIGMALHIFHPRVAVVSESLDKAALTEDARHLETILLNGDLNLDTVAVQHALIQAVKANNLRSIKSLLSVRREMSLNFTGDWPHQTILHIACSHGHKEVVQLLLQREDIDVNATDVGGSTPLHLAACNGHSRIVLQLLKHPSIDIIRRTAQAYFGVPGPEKTAEDLAKEYQQWVIRWRLYWAQEMLEKRERNGEASQDVKKPSELVCDDEEMQKSNSDILTDNEDDDDDDDD